MSKKTLFSVLGVVAFALAFTASAAMTFNYTGVLKLGSSGESVSSLQWALNSLNSAGLSTDGSFGPMTKTAVVNFQTGNGLTADGIVGPATASAINLALSGTSGGTFPAGCTSATGFSATTGASCAGTTTTVPGCQPGYLYSVTTGASCAGGSTGTDSGSLEGTDGTINDVNTLSQYNAEDVGEGQEDVKVAGFEVEATNDGDISLKSLKLSFDPTGNAAGDSDHLDDYIDGVKIWMGDEEIGSADVSDFTENSDDTSSKTITLSGASINSDETEKFYITVDAAGNLDSGDIDSDSWTVVVENLRFIDGSGVVTTDSTTGDLGDTGTTIGSNGTAGDGVPVDFVDFSTAANTELKIKADTDSPEAGIVMIDDTDNTDVELLKGTLELEGDSDGVLDQMPVTFTVTGATDVDNVTGSVTLTLGDEEFTESVSTSTATSATVTFDNLNFAIDAGDTVDFTVTAEVNDIETGLFDEGDTLLASVTSTNRANFDVENEEGDQLAESEKSGTATGEAQEFRTAGIQLTLVSTNATKSASDTNDADSATFEIKFKVAAVGDTVYVATTASTGGSVANTYHVEYSGTSTLTDVTGVMANDTDDDVSSGGNWEIADGDDETLVMTILRTPSATDDLFRAVLDSVRWNITDSSSTYNSYTSNLDSFKTNYVSLD